MTALAVIWAPVRTLANVAEDRRTLLGFSVVALTAALAVVVAAIDALSGVTASQLNPQDLPNLPPEFYETVPEIISVALLVNAVFSSTLR